MKLEKYYQKRDAITVQMEGLKRWSPEWMALDDERMKVVAKISQMTKGKALHDLVRQYAGCHIEGTAL